MGTKLEFTKTHSLLNRIPIQYFHDSSFSTETCCIEVKFLKLIEEVLLIEEVNVLLVLIGKTLTVDTEFCS